MGNRNEGRAISENESTDDENDIELQSTSPSVPSTLNTPMTPYKDTEEGESDVKPLLSTDVEDLGVAKNRLSKSRKRGRLCSLPILLSVGSAVIIAAVIVALVLRQQSGPPHGPYWHGFQSIDHWFVFGDSWSDTHFEPKDEQPSTVNPLGNPEFPGVTSSDARNYIGYLATSYNESFIAAYAMAMSGATVESSVVPSFFDWLDLSHQVKERFMEHYTTNYTSPGGISEPVGWKPESTLFSFFFGINDVANSSPDNPPWDAEFVSYKTLIHEVYNAGARNVVLLNVPPIDRSPWMVEHNDGEKNAKINASLTDYNARVKLMASELRRDLADITVFEFDTHALFTQVMDDPSSIPQTKSYKDTTGYCKLYEEIEYATRPTAEQVASCGGLGIEQYLWYNGFHVTWPVHDAIAAGLKKLLTSGKWNPAFWT